MSTRFSHHIRSKPPRSKFLIQEIFDMPKEIAFGMDIKRQLMHGIHQVGDTVGPTLGPKGRNVVLPGDEKPLITGSVFSTARKIELEDSFENVGASLLSFSTN